MFGKSNIKLRMGLAVLVLCAALFMTALPDNSERQMQAANAFLLVK